MENRSPTQSIAGGPPMFLWLGDPDLLLPPLVEDEDMNLVNSFFEVALPKAAPELVISIRYSLFYPFFGLPKSC